MVTTELIEFVNNFLSDHPEYYQQVDELIQLCRDEIEEGGSPQHEIQLCIESIKQLVED